MKYFHHQTKYIGKQVGLRTYQHLCTLLPLENLCTNITHIAILVKSRPSVWGSSRDVF